MTQEKPDSKNTPKWWQRAGGILLLVMAVMSLLTASDSLIKRRDRADFYASAVGIGLFLVCGLTGLFLL